LHSSQVLINDRYIRAVQAILFDKEDSAGASLGAKHASGAHLSSHRPELPERLAGIRRRNLGVNLHRDGDLAVCRRICIATRGCTSRQSAGPVAPPIRRTAPAGALRLRRRRTPVGWREKHQAPDRHHLQQSPGLKGSDAPAPAVRTVRAGPEPVKSAFGVGCADLRLLGPEAGEWLQRAMPSGPPPARHAARRHPAVPATRGSSPPV
jgi:hypothetical protein